MLISRELGEIPVSLPTAIALESYSRGSELYSDREIMINIRTLFRNILASISRETEYDDEALLSDLIEEYRIIKVHFEMFYQGLEGKCSFYNNTFASIETCLPYAKLKEAQTEGALDYQAKENHILNHFMALYGEDIAPYDTQLEGLDRKAILLTHYPVELLSRYRFSDLLLLESFTGAIKSPTLWNTKLTGGKKNLKIPFNAMTLTLMGDNSTLLKSYPIGIKKWLHHTSEKADWSAATSKEKLLKDLLSELKGEADVLTLLRPILEEKFFF